MTIFWFLSAGVIGLSVLAVCGVLRSGWWGPFTAIGLVVGLATIAVNGEPTHLGQAHWFDESPFKESVMFAFLILGMLSRVFALAIEVKRKSQSRSRKLKIGKWELIYPLIFALPTFAGLLPHIPAESLGIANITLAFQTGFFWQTVIKSFERSLTEEGAL